MLLVRILSIRFVDLLVDSRLLSTFVTDPLQKFIHFHALLVPTLVLSRFMNNNLCFSLQELDDEYEFT